MKHFLSCIICYIAITGCSGDISVLTESNQTTSPLSLTSASVADLTVTRNVFRQSEGPIIANTLPAGIEIGLTLYTANGSNPYGNYESASGKSANLRWRNTETANLQQWQYLTDSGVAANFYLTGIRGDAVAYYPYRAEEIVAPDATGVLAPAIRIEPGTTDYLYGKAAQPVSCLMPTTNISLGHAMSMVSFVFTHDRNYQGNCDLQEVKLKNIPDYGFLALPDGNLSDIGIPSDKNIADFDTENQTYRDIQPSTPVNFRNQPDFGITTLPSEGSVLTGVSRFHLFVIPQEGVSSVSMEAVYLELLIDDIRYRIPFPNDRTLADGSKGFSWKSSVNTLYRIRISKNNVSLHYLTDGFEQGGDSDFEFGRMLR